MIRNILRLHTPAAKYLPTLSNDVKKLSFFVAMRAFEGLLLALMYILLYPILKKTFDGSLTPGFIALVTGLCLACCGLRFMLFRLSAQGIYQGIYAWTGALRLHISEHLRQLPLGMFQQARLTQIKSIMTEDMQIISQSSGSLLGFYISAISIPVFIVIGLAFIEWRMAIILCASTIICLPLLLGMSAFIHKYGHRHFNSLSNSSARLLEYILGIAVLKSYGLANEHFQQMKSALDETKRSNLIMEIGAIILLALGRIVAEMGLPALLIYGLYHLTSSSLDPVVFVFSLVLAMRFYTPIHEAMSLSSEFQYLNAAFERVGAILALEKQTAGSLPATAANDIVFNNVTFSYDSHGPALKNISFKVPENTMTALVGPSGAGKTTITNLITRFWDAQEGEVLMGGMNVRNIVMPDLMSKISAVFQDVILFHDTILGNIRMARPEASDEEVIEAARKAQAHDFIMRLPEGYNTRIGEGGSRLSGGEKQRISIARALLKKAPIVLLDEATASVDPSGEKEIQEAFVHLKKNKTVIAIAHKLSTIIHADQIIVLENGRIVQQGTHRDLMLQEGLYKTLWANQLHIPAHSKTA